MCGIAGVVSVDPRRSVEEPVARRMARAIRHRGPDGYGLALLQGAALVTTRLAIVDVERGWQPLATRPGGPVLAFNGEVYNHPELRRDLEREGLAFETSCDTEVVARALEHRGTAAVPGFNGQFALAFWEPEPRRLTLLRDRFGVRPLFWHRTPDGSLVFGSEAKALFASGLVAPEPDLLGIDEVFTLWGSQAPRTPFRGVSQLPPGHLLVWEDGAIVEERAWWRPVYEGPEVDLPLDELLRDSVRLRLRADVPVGTYLSGGLDSSVITALAQDASPHELRSFSVAFRDYRYDEREHQQLVASRLGTRHHVVDVDGHDIAAAFPDAVWHAESPLIRTAPVPLALLARETRARGITVVASGEGADELYWGYDLFKEVRARSLLCADPASPEAAALIAGLYPHLDRGRGAGGPAWQRFFLDAGRPDDPLFSHQTRAVATGAVKAFYSADVAHRLAEDDPLERLRARLPADFGAWSELERAAYLEVTTLLEPYLLSAQGDRMSMAHGVEGRFPFLDHRVFEHSVRTPAAAKLHGDRDKGPVRDLARQVLPAGVADRPKRPYRAPEIEPFFGEHQPEWVAERLSREALAEVGIFAPERVEGLVRRCRSGRARGMREGMALVGVLSTQLWHAAFCAGVNYEEETAEPKVRLTKEHAWAA
jgi:asparagine synthase (glutamine-hydrolysing)